MSNSRRSTHNQASFREALVGRDYSCILSDTKFTGCTASHILPQSRPEYYEEVLGYDPRYYFHVSYGLLLEDKIHHAFDRGEWALYPIVFGDNTNKKEFENKKQSKKRLME
ncbi:hypothetical protein FA10DRAFT_263348 [Acaromyces ingoldii]|uniref:HNH nuclease domain-containing protein n=1 Tax=Acaromyces ingoldii TaxID=215250 RepID=A0A316Y9M0_9BASI|nr:hypothetical protein FA10DRAFT_263348 [Acaromyces ingoldii]PWN86467.1 hypothetical protein FA10DRAFT_263348 [Acaromyces ingoldii]